NRVKRLLRETYRLNQHKLKLGFDLLLVGRKPMVDVKYKVVSKAFGDLCTKASIFDK
ncbi:MAG: rnpA, partial [Firmicutes bacterium]|nr:rnpA [Bacillota bacterium]